MSWCTIFAHKQILSCLIEPDVSCTFSCFLQSGVTLCWVPSTLCSSTMAAMGPGEFARVGPGGTAVCLAGPGGAYTSATGNSHQQPTLVRTHNTFLFERCFLSHYAMCTMSPAIPQTKKGSKWFKFCCVMKNEGFREVLTCFLFCQTDAADGHEKWIYSCIRFSCEAVLHHISHVLFSPVALEASWIYRSA